MYVYGVRSASNLGGLGYRPSQAAQRIFRQGMGDDGTGIAVDPTLLLAGVGVLAVAMFMFGSKTYPARVRRRRARLKRKLSLLPAI
jgi:hypothetical protein